MGYKYQTSDPVLYDKLKQYSSYNRNHPTEAEELLWEYLRADALGVTFKRQHIIGQFIADFVCLDTKLIVELDGGYHQMPEQQLSDQQRTMILNEMGYDVIRFTNDELFNGIDKVIEKIEEYL